MKPEAVNFLILGMKMKAKMHGDPIFLEFDGTDTTISVMTISPKDFWDSRHELHEKMVKSMEVYNSMNEETRLALISKIQRAMAIMHDQVEEWLPDSLSMDETGNNIRVEFNFLAAEIDKEIQLLDQATSFDIRNTVEKTKSALAELEALHNQA
jgi:hypothetical protein